MAQLLLRIEQAHRYVSEHRPQPSVNTAGAAKDVAPAREAPAAVNDAPWF